MASLEEQAGRLLAQLERVTARLEALSADDVEGIAAAMNERSEAILELGELAARIPADAVPADLLQGLRDQLAATGTIARKLLLLRAAARAELMPLLEAGFMTRSLARRSLQHPNLDCQG